MKGIPLEERCPGWQTGECSLKAPPPPDEPTKVETERSARQSSLLPTETVRPSRLTLLSFLALGGLALCLLIPRAKRRLT
eukprot:g13495.t1